MSIWGINLDLSVMWCILDANIIFSPKKCIRNADIASKNSFDSTKVTIKKMNKLVFKSTKTRKETRKDTSERNTKLKN